MASDMLSVKPDQKCARCTRLLEGCYTTIYGDTNCETIKEVICYTCNLVEYMDDYKKSDVITTKIMMEGSMAKYYFEETDLSRLRSEIREFYMQNKVPLLKVANDVVEIHKLVDEFEDKHWLPYIKKYWNDTDQRGHIAESKNCDVMMWGCAGRVLITAEEPRSSITMIFSDYVVTEEDIKLPYFMFKQRGGIQGITATKEKAIAIMKELIKMKKIKFRPKESVRMAGL
jgi:hypothetical protein